MPVYTIKPLVTAVAVSTGARNGHSETTDSMCNGPDNQNAFIPFQVFRDLKNIRDPDMIIFQPTAAELNTKAIAAVREVVARRHHFDPKDEKATPMWDTIESG